MKTRLFFLAFIALLCVGCNTHTEYHVVSQEHYVTHIDKYHSHDVDSVVFNDGSYATYKSGHGPSNESLVICDKNGKTLFTSSLASETYTQEILFHYDRRGRMIQLLITSNRYYPAKSYNDVFVWPSEENKFEFLRNNYANFDWNNIDTSIFSSYDFEYDKENNIVKVTYKEADAIENNVISQSTKSLEAPEGYKILASVVPCENFWHSDILGGYYHIKCDLIPLDTETENIVVKRYVDLEPMYEYHYKNKQPVKLICLDGEAQIVTKATNGEESVYTLHKEYDNDTTKYIWHNGQLMYKQVISRYGTLLNQDLYVYEDYGATIWHGRIDYKSLELNYDEYTSTEYKGLPSENEMWEIYGDDTWNMYSDEEINPEIFKHTIWQ